MTAYKAPTLAERQGAAAQSRAKALEKLKAKPQPSAEDLQARREAAERREAAAAEKRAAKRAERAKADAERPPAAPEVIGPTEAERKAERDRRYAARKARK